ncbi:CHASE2 domain-containing protein [Novosphingobium sp. TH158]|uniref:CHASE2 domain-containing protein n=1 Tax=Novosphingobium sp. TH158 TaxID=2067455 RepID=UPI000C7D125E|nr:CHASE2 domain-containing protein [Novosphingobium sp. TH158]PLK25872.1 hypothetical protein C0V78_02430 [Novosphingobium sp. TH158]
MPKTRLFFEWLAILLLTVAVAAWALLSGATSRVDAALLDRALVIDASAASDEILLVTVDEGSLAAEGQWPWDRRKVAALVDRIHAAGARAQLLDVLYTEPSDEEADRALANSIRRSGKVALPLGITPAVNRTEGTDVVPPIPILAEAALATGHVGISPDGDGPVRRVALDLPGSTGQPAVKHLALALHQKVEGPLASVASGGANGLAMQLRPVGSYRMVSAAAVLAGEVPESFITGKVVVMGATAQGLGDLFPVPSTAGSVMSGAELLANVYQNLSDGGFVEDLPQSASLLLTVLLLLPLFIAFWALRPLWCVIIATLLVLAALLFSLALVLATHRWFPPAPAIVGLVIAYPLWGWRRLAAINQYLMSKADVLARVDTAIPKGHDEGFDSVARAVNRLDFLVDEISQRREFLLRVVESTPDALCVFDMAGRLMIMNQRARATLGARAADCEGLTAAELLARFGGTLSADGSELVLANGSIFVITRSTGREQGQWPAIHLAMFTDVTAQRRAETERRHALEFLSHDMRSPQVAIMGLTADRTHEESEEARLARIRDHARRTLELADNFIELARMAEAQLDIEEIDLGTLAEEAADRAYPLARERNAQVEVIAPEDPVFVTVDGQLLSRVLDNLIGNALKYGASKVTIGIGEHDGRARLEVGDNGPGLPEERRADPFARFGFRSTGRKGGSGLGLAFVAGAVERHGGTILCQSQSGAGTRFVIDLPRVSAG